MTELLIREFASRAALEAALAERLARAAAAPVATGAVPPAIMLSGGTTPLPAYQALAARAPLVRGDGLAILFSDERYVPSDSPASNYHRAQPLLAALALPSGAVLRVRTELPLEDAARDYEARLAALLRSGTRIGLGLLGLGADGHTASLFGAADLERARGRLAVAVQRPDGMSAVSVSPELLAQVAEPLFLVAGADKRDAVRRLLAKDPTLTAWQAVAGCTRVELWLDEAAAAISEARDSSHESAGRDGRRSRPRAGRALVSLALAGAAPLLCAQTPVADSGAQTPSGPILVPDSCASDTGAAPPIVCVPATAIQPTGLTRVGDVFNTLSVMFAEQSSTLSVAADGTATVDLHGLGPQRALVLVDGRRLGPGGSGGTNVADINQIPLALIDRIDVLTGGASAAYGADAVAGVIKFVLNTRFRGVKLDANYNLYQHHNGDVGLRQLVSGAGQTLPADDVDGGVGRNLSVVVGTDFADDRGNITAYATHDEVAGILQGSYDSGACSLRATGTGSYACGSSGVSASGEFLAFGSSAAPLFDSTVDPRTGRFRPFTASDLYNYSAPSSLLPATEHSTGGAFLSYDLSSRASAYAQLMFTRNRSLEQAAPSGSFFTSVLVPCNDPLLTADERAQICSAANLAAQGQSGAANPTTSLYLGRRNVEGRPRATAFDSRSLRTLLGLKGKIGAWSYDVYALRSTVHDSSDSLNYFSATHVANSLDIVPGPTGPACSSGPPCVPWNIWTPGGVTQAALDYLTIPLHTDGSLTEQVVSGSVTGDLGKRGIRVPATDAGLQLNLGAEWRSERSDFRPDLDSELGNAEGSSGPVAPVSGYFHVSELFAAARLPLRGRDRDAAALAVEGGYRYSRYSEGFNTSAYKLELQWTPAQGLRARAGYQRAIRAPNISELYTPRAVMLDGVTDPCAGATPVYSAAQCASTGVSPSDYGHVGANPAGQYYGLVGGNPRLQPELSDTYTAGLVLEPRSVPELSVALDYFDIRINNVIGPLGADAILSSCASSGSPAYCSLIHRGPGGSLWLSQSGYVSDTNVNFGALSSGGIDLTANYRVLLRRLGFLSFALQGTRVENLTIRPQPGAPGYDCSGYFGDKCGAPDPRWRHSLEATWTTPSDRLAIALRWRYIGPVASEETSANPQLAGAVPGGARVPGYDYLDLTGSLALSRHVVLRLGINNLLDRSPPLFIGADCPQLSSAPSPSSCSGNTFGAPYDLLGRYVFGRLSAQF